MPRDKIGELPGGGGPWESKSKLISGPKYVNRKCEEGRREREKVCIACVYLYEVEEGRTHINHHHGIGTNVVSTISLGAEMTV